ncbi:VapC toxin family PIN domain ribonuclease [Burkholderia stagnalis]|uniref:VapC toxin family PIN domain ribonuclease n=1 Tax=Burkholderia stagnalis TaxID=1503054 RepID=UPI0039BFBCC5
MTGSGKGTWRRSRRRATSAERARGSARGRQPVRGDLRQASTLEAWLATILSDYAPNILPIDVDVDVDVDLDLDIDIDSGQRWGHLRVPHPEHALDKLIAATALIDDLTVVTRNVDDFAKTGVRPVNPFD